MLEDPQKFLIAILAQEIIVANKNKNERISNLAREIIQKIKGEEGIVLYGVEKAPKKKTYPVPFPKV